MEAKRERLISCLLAAMALALASADRALALWRFSQCFLPGARP